MLDKLFLQILNMSFTASFVIAFVLLIRLLLKKTPKIFSYALWSVVLFRLICPFSFESVFSVLPTKANPAPTNIGFMQAPKIDTEISIINDSINPILPEATPVASINPLQIWMFLGEILWLLGIVALLIYSLVTLYKLIKKLKGARCLNDNIYMSDNISTAFVLGVVHPKIYLPLSLNNKEQDYILLHEQTHIKRLDHIVKILAFLVLCVHWFNPLVWVAFFAFSKDMEQACDEAVIKTLGNEVKKDYSASLLSLATGKRIVGGTPLAFGEGDTKSRVKNVLNYKKPAFWALVVTTIAVVVAVFCLVSNPAGTTIRNPYVQEYVVGATGILGSVDTEEYTEISEDFSIGADKYGRAVFKEPHKAFATFETLYADAIKLIKSANDLKPFSHKNYEMYKVYGWQLTGGSKKEQERARFVTNFLDIYENSFVKGVPNTQYPLPTIGDTNGVSTEKLWENRTEYVGNNSAVGNIISNLSFPNDISYKDFELHTKERPYAITVNFKTDTETRNFYSGASHQQEFMNNALIMFSLIGNAEYITFSFDDGEIDPFGIQYTSGQAKAVLGEDYFEQTKTIDGFRKTLNTISQNNAPLTYEQAEEIVRNAYPEPLIVEADGDRSVKKDSIAYSFRISAMMAQGDSQEQEARLIALVAVEKSTAALWEYDMATNTWNNANVKTPILHKDLTKETANEFIYQTLGTFKLNSDNTISFTLPAVIPTDENGKTKLYISSSATFSAESGMSSVQEILDWKDDWQGGESYAEKLDTSKGKLTRIFLRVAFMTTEGENSYQEYAADYIEFTEPFKLDTTVSITDRSVEINKLGAYTILNYTMQNGDNFSVTLTLPKGLELSTSENYAEYASTSGGEMPTVVAVKEGNLIGTLTLSEFGTDNKDALTQTDTAENTLPMQIFAPVALSNHAEFDNYKVCKSSATGANATAKYLWQDLTDYGGHTPDAPWLKSDCILAYDYGKIPFFINLNLADGSLGITEFENLAKSIVIAD